MVLTLNLVRLPVRRCAIAFIAAACALLTGVALGANPATAMPTATFDPSQPPTAHGIVAQFTIMANGRVDGFVLQEGTQVLTDPQSSEQIVRKVHRGDPVTVFGIRARSLPLILALAVLDESPMENVFLGAVPLMLAVGELPPQEHATAPSATAPVLATQPTQRVLTESDVHGNIKRLIYSPRGTVNGAFLSDGTELRLGSVDLPRVARLFRVGSAVEVRGIRTDGPAGQVVVVHRIQDPPARP